MTGKIPGKHALPKQDPQAALAKMPSAQKQAAIDSAKRFESQGTNLHAAIRDDIQIKRADPPEKTASTAVTPTVAEAAKLQRIGNKTADIVFAVTGFPAIAGMVTGALLTAGGALGVGANGFSYIFKTATAFPDALPALGLGIAAITVGGLLALTGKAIANGIKFVTGNRDYLNMSKLI